MARIALSVRVSTAAGSDGPTSVIARSMAARASMVISAPGTPWPAQSMMPSRQFPPSERNT